MILANTQLLEILGTQAEQSLEQRVNIFATLNPKTKLLRLDRGDVVRPLSTSVIEAMQASVAEMAQAENFKGRGPSRGYPFLIDAIVKNEYKGRKIKVESDEVFVNNGTKDGLSGIGDILCHDVRVAVVDPVYQTYIESNVMAGRAGERLESGEWSHRIYLNADAESNFQSTPPEARPDVIYLCSPNDPTGCVMSREELEKWVKYAAKNDVLILFDATYAPFIKDESLPRSIYEIKGARKVAIEFRSFSKSAGFTGLHCGYMVIPKEIQGYSFSSEKSATLNELWCRREEIKSYPPSYVVQRAAEAIYSPQGAAELKESVECYMKNASLLCEGLKDSGLRFWGGENSPYIWVESPYESSWKLLDKLIEQCNIVVSPGERFGVGGAGYVRLSAFADQNEVIRASTRLSDFRI